MSFDFIKDCFTLKKKQGADNGDGLRLLANTPAQIESLSLSV